MSDTATRPVDDNVELLHKVQRGWANLSQVRDEHVEIATTAKEVVFRRDKMTLYRYLPIAPRRQKTPLLMIYSQIGRYTMLDLQPDRSVTRNLLEQGIEVYVIDWGEPNRSDRWIRFDDYVEDYVAGCVDCIAERDGVDKVALLGVCQGGVFAACYAALHPDRVERLALAVTPIDFHADQGEDDVLEHGYLNRWTRNLTPAELAEFVDSFGIVPGAVTGLMFQEMTPVKTLTKYNWDLPDAISGDRDQVLNFLRMEKWLSDRPHHPGEAAKQWLIELYNENRLVAERFHIDGQPVRLRNLTMPVLNIFASRDHIVPPATSRALRHHVGTSDYQELEINAGHIGTFVSRKANRLFSDAVSQWLAARQRH